MEKRTKRLYRKVATYYHAFRLEGKAANNEFLVTPATIKLLGNVRGKRVLDLGCGTGIISLKLRKKGAKVSGIDLSPEMLKIAKTYAKNIDFKLGSAERLPYDSENFDIVVSVLVFDYVKNLGKALNEVWRVLKLNGYFIVAVRNPVTTVSHSIKSKKIKFALKNKTVREFDRYFVERIVSHNWWSRDSKLHAVEYDIHRTYETLIKSYIRSGFAITDYVDPKPIKGYKGSGFEDAKWWYRFANDLPSFCIFKLKKCLRSSS